MERLRDLVEPRELVVLDICHAAIGLRFVDPTGDTDVFAAIRQHFLPAPVTDAEPDAVLRIGRGELPYRFEGPALERFRGDEFRRSAEGTWQAWSRRSVAQWDDSGGSILLAPGTDPFDAAISVASVLHTIARRGSAALPIHAGVVAGDKGAALIVGESGQGKSTTIGAAVHAGLSIGSDDAAFIESADDGFVVRGFPRTPMVPAEILTDGAGDDPSLDHRERIALNDQELESDWLPLRYLLFVGHGTVAATETSEVSRGDATRALIVSITDRFESTAGAGLQLDVVSRVSALPRYRLALGTDTATRTQSTGAALRELLQ